MRTIINTNKTLGLITLVLLFMVACSKMNEYKEYMKGGEINYTGKLDSVRILSGYNRVQVTGLFVSDPKITSVLIYWNTRADSILMPVVRTANVDSFSAFVNIQNEGLHNFEIYTVDKLGNRSVPVYASGMVYGKRFSESMINRPIINAAYSKFRGSVINWGTIDTLGGAFATELSYVNSEGVPTTITIPISKTSTVFYSLAGSGDVKYRTLYLPDTLSVDTFKTNFQTVVLSNPLFLLDKSKFREKWMPGDVGSAWGWLMPAMWDGFIEGWAKGFHTFDADFPQKFTFDLGVETELKDMRIWQRLDRIYNGNNLKRWEVWGSTNPAADGSYNGWVKIMDCLSVKPSGLPLGQTTEDDRRVAREGEFYEFPATTPTVRYLRFKVLEVWMPNDRSAAVMEITLRGDF